MSLFVCDNCDVIENTAVSRFAIRNWDASGLDGKAFCSLCDPEIQKWHWIVSARKMERSNRGKK